MLEGTSSGSSKRVLKVFESQVASKVSSNDSSELQEQMYTESDDDDNFDSNTKKRKTELPKLIGLNKYLSKRQKPKVIFSSYKKFIAKK
jgi:hypothetical protein